MTRRWPTGCRSTAPDFYDSALADCVRFYRHCFYASALADRVRCYRHDIVWLGIADGERCDRHCH